MNSLEKKSVLVVGLGASGRAASEFLRRRGARVRAADEADTPDLRAAAEALEQEGIPVTLGAAGLPEEKLDLVVVSPGVPGTSPLVAGARARGVEVIGELELGYQNSLCLNIAISGTNGKTTTTEVVGRLLSDHGLKTRVAGNIGVPVCAVAEETRDLDFLTLEVSSFQLETIRYFRPAVAVLLNLSPDHMDRYETMEEYVRAKGRMFENQQAFDWAIIQSEALAALRVLNVRIPSKIITFSAGNRRADIYLERGMLISRIEGWSGVLLDLDKCQLRGPHNAENLMAALALGRVLRIPLEVMVESLKTYRLPPHRCELVRTVNGVDYINDSKSTNLDSLCKALLSHPTTPGGDPHVWLIAGGRDKGFDFHDIGPLLSRQVKGAFLFGEARERIRSAWSLFTPCTLVDSLLEAVAAAAKSAVAGDLVLLSPACSSFDQFRNYQHRGEVFRQAVADLPSRETGSGTAKGSGRGPIRWKADRTEFSGHSSRFDRSRGPERTGLAQGQIETSA